MRAVLVFAVLMAWMTCLCGGAGFSLYLATIAVSAGHRRLRGVTRRPSRPAGVLVAGAAAFAAVMAACAVALGASVRWPSEPGPWSSSLAWAALPGWAALVAAMTAVVLERRRRLASRWG